MTKFDARELKMSFFLAQHMGLKNPVIEIIEGGNSEVVTVENARGELVVFNPFTIKSNFFDVYNHALDNMVEISAFKHNIRVKNCKTGETLRRTFAPTKNDRTIHIVECVANVLGFKE